MKAIDIIKQSITTHEDWATYFERHPETEKLEKHKNVGGAASHRAQIKQYNQAIEEIEQLEAENEKLRDALQSLYNEQNGPPLLRHEKDWQATMDEAETLLGDKP